MVLNCGWMYRMTPHESSVVRPPNARERSGSGLDSDHGYPAHDTVEFVRDAPSVGLPVLNRIPSSMSLSKTTPAPLVTENLKSENSTTPSSLLLPNTFATPSGGTEMPGPNKTLDIASPVFGTDETRYVDRATAVVAGAAKSAAATANEQREDCLFMA